MGFIYNRVRDGENMKDIKIYCMAHKLFNVPSNKIYVPLQVGAELHDNLGYVRDNEGDNISKKNPFYSELTGFYWMWKNDVTSDVKGLCHYRRFFLNEKGTILEAAEVQNILSRFDMIVSGRAVYEQGTIYENYGEKHYTKDLDLTGEVIKEKYPDYCDSFKQVMEGKETYFANMFIASKDRADAYAKWLFDILFEVEKRLDMTGYDDYNRRVFGFISERLLTVWIRKNRLRVYECPVGLTESKAETKDAISRASALLEQGDYQGTLDYLDLVQTNRPDAFYKDSDTDGELALIYTFAEIMAAENKSGHDNLRKLATKTKTLIEIYKEYQNIIYNNPTKLYNYIVEHDFSLYFNLIMIPKIIEDKNSLINMYNILANAYLDHSNIEVARVYVNQAISLGN